MGLKIVFTKKAEFDLQDAFDWYEGASEGLGERFINVVETSVNLIAERPVAFPAKREELREKILKGFPYLIVYEISAINNTLYILRVFHTSQDPSKKY